MNFEERWSSIIKKREILGFDTVLCVSKGIDDWFITKMDGRFTQVGRAYNLKDLLDEEDNALNHDLKLLIDRLDEKIDLVKKLLHNDSTAEVEGA